MIEQNGLDWSSPMNFNGFIEEKGSSSAELILEMNNRIEIFTNNQYES
jgi:hypothetical protein